MLRTFSIQTLGCRVNRYESDQLATLLRARGLAQVERGGDLQVINTCSVTMQAASKSRQTVRRTTRLPVLHQADDAISNPVSTGASGVRPRVLVTGCWATSNLNDARQMAGVDAAIGHHHDLAAEIDTLLTRWNAASSEETTHAVVEHGRHPGQCTSEHATKSLREDRSIVEAGIQVPLLAADSKPIPSAYVKKKVAGNTVGTRSLPLLHERQSHHQRAFLKVQDGCDAHCTYCIIPQLRPTVWSKPVHEAVEEARSLVASGHREIVLTGIFLGAYGQPTALRRRQPVETAKPLAELVSALCMEVKGLHRLRFSSLEPGDLTPQLIEVLRSYPQVVPHFHLPLQSGSDVLLRRMNRQYTRDAYLRMIEQVYRAFDQPAITTDIIVGFPGETDHEFAQTLEVEDRVRFIHIHAFSFSPRPGTAVARWEPEFVRGPVVNRRIERLNERALAHGLAFRQQCVGQMVELLVEGQEQGQASALRHGRCERYFDVWFENAQVQTGDAVRVRITQVTPTRTFGEVVP